MMISFLINNYQHILIGYGYYKVAIGLYDTYDKGVSMYNGAKWLYKRSGYSKDVNTNNKFIVLEEDENGYTIIDQLK